MVVIPRLLQLRQPAVAVALITIRKTRKMVDVAAVAAVAGHSLD